ncbi:hypothetical protein GCM10010104_62310 [Streptomyces indiaensis]|uniref:Uncharacterized protein n=1 Tax=Streptomyces indiaensis TaxID=284033 RepID=A0ABN3EFB9_9ACTN
MVTVGGLDSGTGFGVRLRGHAGERRHAGWGREIGVVCEVRGFPRQVVDGTVARERPIDNMLSKRQDIVMLRSEEAP